MLIFEISKKCKVNDYEYKCHICNCMSHEVSELHINGVKPVVCNTCLKDMLNPEKEPAYISPDWEDIDKVHDWRNYISEDLQNIWDEIEPKIKKFVYKQAENQASNEEWD